MRGYARLLHITPSAEERAALCALVEHGSAAEARRARALLLRANGATYAEVERETGMPLPTTLKWARRFVLGGLPGLRDRRFSCSTTRPPVA
jgi:Homeodomain-like domain